MQQAALKPTFANVSRTLECIHNVLHHRVFWCLGMRGSQDCTCRMGVLSLAACATLSFILLAARMASLLPGSS